MRKLIMAAALIVAPITVATAEDETETEAKPLALPEALPEQMTPETLSNIAAKLETLSRIRLVRASGGRSSAARRRTDAVRTKELAIELQAAASALSAAQTGKAQVSENLARAETGAMNITRKVASEIGDLDISRELFELLESPEPEGPEPVTHVFCMEASGAGPQTFKRYAPEALTQAIPYVQGYITHTLDQTAPKKLRLELTVEHDADAAPFGAIDALQAANAAAVAEMSEAKTAAETILMGDLAERLCSPTPPRGQ